MLFCEVYLMRVLPRLSYGPGDCVWSIARPITVGVRVFLVRDGMLLLVRHTYQDAWYLPGGGVEGGETLEEAIRREAAEEVGAELGELDAVWRLQQLLRGQERSRHRLCVYRVHALWV